MKNRTIRFALLAVMLSVVSTLAAADVPAAAISFNLRVADKIDGVTAPLSGRLLIFMKKDDGKPTDGFGVDDFDPNAVWVSGTEITNLEPDKPIEIDPDSLSYPSAFSSAPAGNYLIFAILDRNHSYTYNGPGPGDVYSQVVRSAVPFRSAEITLYKAMPSAKIDVPKNFRVVEFASPLLSAFWGRPITMKASVLLPPSYDKSNLKYPTIYTVSGYGGTHLNSLRGGPQREKEMTDGKRPEMISVFLEAQVPLGHNVFADSSNNGPWNTALILEFIPYLEKQFRMDAKPSGRFLTGHSSGGWTTLWVMITNPDFFGGTWSSSPDPVDFRSFTGPDLYTNKSAYTDSSGKEYNLLRDKGKELISLKQYAQQERVLGNSGGQMASFNAVFSPKGDDGQPMKLFDIDTGRIDPEVLKAWEKYDISHLLRNKWKTLGPKLKGKLHIFVGTADTFHLDEPTRLLDAELKKLGSDAEFTYLDGKTHFDMYQEGLTEKMQWSMYKIARPNAKAAGK